MVNVFPLFEYSSKFLGHNKAVLCHILNVSFAQPLATGNFVIVLIAWVEANFSVTILIDPPAAFISAALLAPLVIKRAVVLMAATLGAYARLTTSIDDSNRAHGAAYATAHIDKIVILAFPADDAIFPQHGSCFEFLVNGWIFHSGYSICGQYQ